MKKSIGLLAITLGLCLLLVGCGAGADITETPDAGFISEVEAIEIAEQHFGIENETRDEQTGYLISYAIEQTPTDEMPQYIVALQWLVEVDGQPSHQSRLDVVTIDAVSGNVVTDPA